MELDARTAVDGTTISADLCIVGAGPVGLALAHALGDSGLQLVLLESGGFLPDDDVQELNAGTATGDPYHELQLSRARGVGGTVGRWNTMVGGEIGAKYLPMDQIDFEARPWAPLGGWPFSRDTLDPFYRRAHSVCGLGPFDYAAATWSDARHPLLRFADGGLTNGVYQCGRASAFTGTIVTALRASSRVMVVHGATMTRLSRATGGGRVSEAQWATLSGSRGVVRASYFVLAAGGIENARILLLHRRQRDGRRADNDWLGRGFMEHPIDRSLELISRAPALAAAPSFYGPHSAERTPAIMGRMALSPEMLRELKVPNASVRLIEVAEPRVLQAAAARTVARRLVPVPALRRTIGNAIRRAASARNRLRGSRYPLLIDLEQLPHRDNRVVVTDRLDRLGQPQAGLHWRWRAEDEAHRKRIIAAIARELTRSGIGRTRRVTDQLLDPNAHHHAGTTRMHDDPAEGVVDRTLRVHGEENLYVAGASVFPTAGFANPTLTAVALTLRLADWISRRP